MRLLKRVRIPFITTKGSHQGVKRSQRGFTLVETLVAAVILAGGITVLATSWSGNFTRVRNARLNNTMAALLERKMSEYEIQYRDKSPNEIPEEEGGDFGPKYPGYRWSMSAEPFEMPDLSSLLTSKEGGADEFTLMIGKMTSEYVKEAVKEVSVTVYYRGRVGGEIKHSVTTYFIDYTKEINMPGLPAGMGGAGGS